MSRDDTVNLIDNYVDEAAKAEGKYRDDQVDKYHCKTCGGHGSYADHDSPITHQPDGECTSCPVQVQCEKCRGTGCRPRRIQRKRTKGWRMPENTVYVGRPSRWGNPHSYNHSRIGTRVAIGLYMKDILVRFNRAYIKEELAGKNLACWCPLDQPCHADVLLRIANEEV